MRSALCMSVVAPSLFAQRAIDEQIVLLLLLLLLIEALVLPFFCTSNVKQVNYIQYSVYNLLCTVSIRSTSPDYSTLTSTHHV